MQRKLDGKESAKSTQGDGEKPSDRRNCLFLRLYRFQGSKNPERAAKPPEHLDNCTGNREKTKSLRRPVAIEESRRPENCNESSQGKKSSEQEHRVDAKAPSAEEGRGKLRKARGSRKQA